jgi:AcrR family transcriptional regulator
VGANGLLGSDLLLRNEPVQARSAARLSSLLDAAAEVVEEVGYERLTTAMVAERAGASIGTVYRYFPDRIAVLEGLSARAFRRFLDRITEHYRESRLDTVEDRVSAAVDVYVELYRTERGFRVVRFGDVVDVRLLDGRRSNTAVLAERIADIAGERGSEHDPEELVFRLQVVIALIEALIHRAFVVDPRGDEAFVAEAKAVGIDYVRRHLGPSGAMGAGTAGTADA